MQSRLFHIFLDFPLKNTYFSPNGSKICKSIWHGTILYSVLFKIHSLSNLIFSSHLLWVLYYTMCRNEWRGNCVINTYTNKRKWTTSLSLSMEESRQSRSITISFVLVLRIYELRMYGYKRKGEIWKLREIESGKNTTTRRIWYTTGIFKIIFSSFIFFLLFVHFPNINFFFSHWNFDCFKLVCSAFKVLGCVSKDLKPYSYVWESFSLSFLFSFSCSERTTTLPHHNSHIHNVYRVE